MPEQDAAFSQAADQYGNEGYGLLNHNCYLQGVAGVNSANETDPEYQIDIDNGIRPNEAFENNSQKGWRNHPIER